MTSAQKVQDYKLSPIIQESRCDIVFKNLSYSVSVPDKNKQEGGPFAKKAMMKKSILKNVNGVFRSGRLTAIMGASGAGKTSLLEILAGEIHQGEVSGEVLVNGNAVDVSKIKKISGFVFQQDVILGTMTVREAISMSATLRLGKNVPEAEKQTKVEHTIELLGLQGCADTVIGDVNMKGISGGQRKRVAIAMELITNPYVVFLDEPTSGLDTYTAHSVICILKELAKNGATVIATIHQPSSDIYHLFDDLLLLAQGQVMYQGDAEEAVGYFSKLGYPCPQYTNPADHFFMRILNNEAGSAAPETMRKLLAEYSTGPQSQALANRIKSVQKKDILPSSFKVSSSFATQYAYLFHRASKNAFRNPFIVRAKMGQNFVISLIIGLLYFRMNERTGPAAVQDRAGILFFLAINYVFSSAIGLLSIFGAEKEVFTREHGAGYYSLAAYYWSKIMVEVPFQLNIRTIIYWMTGLQPDAGKYFILVCAIVGCSVSGFGLGIFFASIFSSLPMALTATPLILLPLMLFSGLYVNQETIPVYFDWIKYISPMKYGYEAMVKNEFTGLVIPSGSDGVPDIKGEDVISSLGFDDGLSILICILILLGMVVFLLSTAYLALYRVIIASSKSVPIRKPSSQESEKDHLVVQIQ